MTQDPSTIELYVRSLAPTAIRDKQESVIERLEQLADADRIEEFEVILCGDCICASLTTAKTALGQRLLDRHESFEAWARRHDRSLVGFADQDIESSLSGQRLSGITFPKLALAEYRGGELAFVAPSRNGDEITTVLDHLREY